MIITRHPESFPGRCKLGQKGYLDKSVDAYIPKSSPREPYAPRNSPREPEARIDKFFIYR
jgi:hypothetical protein